MGENTRQNCTRQNKKKNPGRQQPCWGFLFCTNLTQPTGALDSHSAQMLLETMGDMNEKLKTTFIMVTHDALSASYAKRVIFLKDGKIYCELQRGEKERRKFFNEILDSIALLGGERKYVS